MKEKKLKKDYRESCGVYHGGARGLWCRLVVFLMVIFISAGISIGYGGKYAYAADTFTIGTIQTQFYTGSALTPAFVVKSGSKVLQEGADYSVTYKNNVNIGLATAEVTGKGSYSGTDSKTFTIKPPSVSIQKIEPRQQEADVVMNKVGGGVRYQARITKSDGSFQYSTGDSNTVTVRGLEMQKTYPLAVRTIKEVDGTTYYGAWSEEKTFTTGSAIDIKGAVFSKVETYTYVPGREWKPVPEISYNGTVLKKGKDYDLSYSDNVNAGTATITATGKGMYTGIATTTFTIAKRKLSDCAIPGISPVAYTGRSLSPDPGVRYGVWVKNGTDYTISYENNVEIGKGTATLTGKGNFTGSVTKPFTVKPPLAVVKSIVPGQNTADIELDPAGGDVQYVAVFTDPSGKETKSYSKTSTWTATKLSPNTTYTVQVRTFKTINGYTYVGDLTQKQTITTNGVMDLKDAEFGKIDGFIYTPGKECKPVPTVTLNGKTLKKGTDYTLSYKNNINAGNATVIATGMGVYTGTASKVFKIYARDINTCYIPNPAPAADYTGGSVTPDPGVRYGEWLTLGRDYDVTYSNNTAIGNGTAVAFITGKGNYKDTVKRKFTIRPPAADIASLEKGENTVTAVLTPKSCSDKGVQWQICVYPEGTQDFTYITSDTNTLTAKKIPANTNYCIKARLIKKIGDNTVYGAWSEPQVFKVDQHYHHYTSVVKESPTCTEPGLRIYTCTGCGEKKTANIPAIGHKMHFVAGKSATCTGRGHTETYTCRMCGMRFRDKDGKKPIELSSLLSQPLGHSFKVTSRVEPTLRETGTITWTCSRCGETRKETIPLLQPGNTEIQEITVGQKQIKAELKAVSGNVSYELYVRRANEANGRWSDSDETTVTVADLTSNTDYMIKARTFVEVNGVKSYGEWTPEIPVHTKELTTTVKGKNATCQAEGNILHLIGKSTGNIYQDESQTVILSPEDVIIPKLDHEFVRQTDATGATVLVCKKCHTTAK